MKIRIDTTKSIEENATHYYDKSKKAKRKIDGLKKAIEVSKRKIAKVDKKLAVERHVYEKPAEKKWYQKFRWFYSTNGFLCIGGRDATTNEIVVKKYTEKGDKVFHAELPGSPFFVVKSEGQDIPKQTMQEAAQATASFSRAWREGFSSAEVYAINPDQVKKELGLPKGSFMIHGKREYFEPVVKLYVGLNSKKELECTPVKRDFELSQGGKRSETAKKIQKKIMDIHNIKFELDDVVRILPGDCSLV